jgi:hypothetical protein
VLVAHAIILPTWKAEIRRIKVLRFEASLVKQPGRPYLYNNKSKMDWR